MASNYRKLGGYIREIDRRNTENRQDNLLGLSVAKCFIPSIANTVGTDFRKYKVVEKGQFAYIPDTSRRGDKIAIALLENWDSGLVSNVYTVFEVVGEGLLPKYLELWFRRPEFDRYARFKSHGSVREIFDWEQLCAVELPVPSIAEQQKIVDSFNAIEWRISTLQRLNDKLAAWRTHIFEHRFGRYKADCLEGKAIDGWSRVRLGDLADFTYGKMVPASKRTERGIPVYSGYGITGYCKEAMFTEAQLIVVARGVSGTGNVRITPDKCYLTNLSIAVLLYDRADMGYLFEYLSGDNLISLDSGSAQSMITIGDLAAHYIALPTKEQVKEYDEVFQPIKRLMDANEREIEKLSRAKGAYVSALGC